MKLDHRFSLVMVQELDVFNIVYAGFDYIVEADNCLGWKNWNNDISQKKLCRKELRMCSDLVVNKPKRTRKLGEF